MGKLLKFSILILVFLTILCGFFQNDNNSVMARKMKKGSTRTVYMLRHPKMKSLSSGNGKHGDGKFSDENLLHHHHEKLHHHHHNGDKIGHKKKHHGQISPL